MRLLRVGLGSICVAALAHGTVRGERGGTERSGEPIVITHVGREASSTTLAGEGGRVMAVASTSAGPGDRGRRDLGARFEHVSRSYALELGARLADEAWASAAEQQLTDTRQLALDGVFAAPRLHALGLEHALVLGGGLVRAAAETHPIHGSDPAPGDMTLDERVARPHARSDHRILDAYLQDTVRLIRSLDVSAGFVVERWSHLTGIRSVGPRGEEMDRSSPDVSELLVSPSMGAVYRAGRHLTVTARASRRLRPPALLALQRDIVLDDARITADLGLRPERAWTTALEPALVLGAVTARATLRWTQLGDAIGLDELGSGVYARTNVGDARLIMLTIGASWRATSSIGIDIDYSLASSRVQATGEPLALVPRHRAHAGLRYQLGRSLGLTGVLRYIGASSLGDRRADAYLLVDAVATRTIHRGLAGFVAVDNALDRRDVIGAGGHGIAAPRTVRAGLRVDTAAF